MDRQRMSKHLLRPRQLVHTSTNKKEGKNNQPLQESSRAVEDNQPFHVRQKLIKKDGYCELLSTKPKEMKLLKTTERKIKHNTKNP
ncbi:hypothetical protein CJ030_MR7G011636 [Morella rubra]|uniref:Uncharacterized protein n=1 Tax=Morella rubra TaxID=262757 RepID=A0A6A1V3M9_9ROSI|nr:hypothetical protein CJ030_MR7G011636 [Morella rubra]